MGRVLKRNVIVLRSNSLGEVIEFSQAMQGLSLGMEVERLLQLGVVMKQPPKGGEATYTRGVKPLPVAKKTHQNLGTHYPPLYSDVLTHLCLLLQGLILSQSVSSL